MVLDEKQRLVFEIRSVGLNPFASEYAGMSSKRTIILSMMISGTLAGLGGAVQGLGTFQKLLYSKHIVEHWVRWYGRVSIRSR